jgi:hypothetical protein
MQETGHCKEHFSLEIAIRNKKNISKGNTRYIKNGILLVKFVNSFLKFSKKKPTNALIFSVFKNTH